MESFNGTLSYPNSADLVEIVQEELMIFVTFALPGIHCYPEAPEEVSYLRSPHRHMFGFKVGVNVTHANRDIEFHMFKNWCIKQYGASLELNNKSCEMIAQELATLVRTTWGTPRIEIEVWEDQECGARLTQKYDRVR